MKVTAFVGSARKKHTYNTTLKFLKNLEESGNVDTEIISLADYNLNICRGCKLCLDRGEERCPLKDDRDLLLTKMKESDGVIFASPNYSFQVSGQMKVFIDRLGFFLHRPMFFGKTYTSIVAQGVYGGKNIVKYLDLIGSAMGFNCIKGMCINTLEPMPEDAEAKIDRKIQKLSSKFYHQLVRREYPKPSLFKLMIYRMSRTSMKLMQDDSFRDYRYYTEKGWFESDYYYPVKLNPLKRVVGWIFDRLARKMAVQEGVQQ